MTSIEKPKDISMLLLAALLGGGAGSFGLNMGANPRPDPFTGAEGRALASQIHTLEKGISAMRFELGKESRAMPSVRRLEYRMNTLESRYRNLNGSRSRSQPETIVGGME